MTWSSLNPLARVVYAGCQMLWSAGFALVGRFDHNVVQRWSPIGGGHVLVVAPHPDDECTGCGGTLVLHSRANDDITVLQITDGQGARAPSFEGQSMAQVRQREARFAAAILGVHLEQLSLPERVWREELRRVLRAWVVEMDPDVVYAPSCVDFHPDHLRVARTLAAALDSNRERPRIRVYEVTVPLTLLANGVADTSNALAAHDAALDGYRSQAFALRVVRRMRQYRARYYGMVHAAEVFWELAPRDYRTLMARGDWLGPNEWSSRHTPYRSLRARPFTDPLAYWQGRNARQFLKQLITDNR